MEVNTIQYGNAIVGFAMCTVLNLAVLKFVLKRNQKNKREFFRKHALPSKNGVVTKERD